MSAKIKSTIYFILFLQFFISFSCSLQHKMLDQPWSITVSIEVAWTFLHFYRSLENSQVFYRGLWKPIEVCIDVDQCLKKSLVVYHIVCKRLKIPQSSYPVYKSLPLIINKQEYTKNSLIFKERKYFSENSCRLQ